MTSSWTSPSSVSAICLILVLIMNCQAESGPMKKFGCTFENEDYLVRTDSVFNAKYGEEVAPMEIASTREFAAMFVKIKSIYAKTMKDVVNTNMPAFFDFYDAYKSNFTGDFDAFYRAYIPKYLPDQMSSSMAVILLDNLIAEIPDMKDHCHLISSYVNVVDKDLRIMVNPDEFISSKKQTTGENDTQGQSTEPPKYIFRHGNVAALLRIMLPNQRLGYVLMDLGFALSNPVVLMMDGGSPTWANSVGYARHRTGENFQFRISSNQNYVLATTSYTDPKLGILPGEHERHLYFIARPYCSFLLTTEKLNVYRSFKFLDRRSETGASIVRLEFDFFTVINMPPQYVIMTHRPGTTVLRYRKIIPLGGFLEILDGEERKNFNEAIENFNVLNIEEMLTKAEEIYSNKAFLWQIRKLSKKIYRY